MAHGTGTPSGIMSTYNDPENTRSAIGSGIETSACRGAGRHGSTHPALLGLTTASRSEEVHLSSPAFRFALIRRPVPLGAVNAWTAPETEDFGAISKALPLCVCTPGFIGEDLL